MKNCVKTVKKGEFMIVYNELASIERDLGFPARTLYGLSNNLEKHYHYVFIPKSDGSKRKLSVPDLILKRAQKSIADNINNVSACYFCNFVHINFHLNISIIIFFLFYKWGNRRLYFYLVLLLAIHALRYTSTKPSYRY